MKKDPYVYIDDIYESIQAIKAYTHDLSKEKFLNSSEKQDAVYRRIEVIGEAANRLPDDFRVANPEITWHKIIGMRNSLIHEYDNIDLDRVWETIKRDIPELELQIKEILKSS